MVYTGNMLKHTLHRFGRIAGRKVYIDVKNPHEIQSLIKRDIPSGEGKFFSPKPAPIILDCGAHIGVMTLYFKIQYPRSKIFCFEPNVISYRKLVDNIEGNGLRDVVPINAALAETDGEAILYGAKDGETRGNSISKDWGSRGRLTTVMPTKTVRLSTYLNQKVDFLKLDVEGVEYEVLNECQGLLKNVREIELEVHETLGCGFTAYDVELLLIRNGFIIKNKKSRNITTTLPEMWHDWSRQANPNLTVIRAFNPLYDLSYS